MTRGFTHERVWFTNLIIACFISLSEIAALAQTPICNEAAATARMARAKSSTILISEKSKAGDGYRSQVVFAARMLELRPHSRVAALRLLELLPKDDEQQTVWTTFGDSICQDEPVSDMRSLGHLGETLPHIIGSAVLLAPERLPGYVAYALVSVKDPHSDYAVQMEAVCRAKHPEFVKAVKSLPADKRSWFSEKILNPDECHALALPEAD